MKIARAEIKQETLKQLDALSSNRSALILKILSFAIKTKFKPKQEKPKESITFRIPQELNADLDKLCGAHNLSKSKLIASMLEAFLDEPGI